MSGKFEKERIGVIFEVELKELKEQKVLSLREKISSYDKEGMLWEKLGRFMAENQVACEASGYSIYHDEDYRENDVDVEIAVPVAVLGESQGEFVYKEIEAIPLAATIRFSGPYDGYSATMEKLASWVEQNNYVFAGMVRGFAIVPPSVADSPEEYMTEIQVEVKKA